MYLIMYLIIYFNLCLFLLKKISLYYYKMGGCFSYDKKTSLESNKCSSCNLDEFEKRINPLIDNIKLSKYKRNILKKRYSKLVVYYDNYAANVRWKYNMCRIIISIGSMILPTLQTIQNNENVAFIKNEIFWAAIGTSLSVMISNNLISMFALDRRYIMYAVTAEKLKAIGWKYFELSDMFSNKSHIENWILFWNEVEKIKKLQVLSEFTDSDDKNHEPPPTLENTRQESDSEYDSDTPRTRTPRTTPRSIPKKDMYDNEEVIVNMDNRRKIITDAQNTFKQKFTEKMTNTENTISDNIDKIESNIENNIKKIIDKKKVEIDESKNVEIVLEDLQNSIVENLDIKKKD